LSLFFFFRDRGIRESKLCVCKYKEIEKRFGIGNGLREDTESAEEYNLANEAENEANGSTQ
jgi:hypothetical protein